MLEFNRYKSQEISSFIKVVSITQELGKSRAPVILDIDITAYNNVLITKCYYRYTLFLIILTQCNPTTNKTFVLYCSVCDGVECPVFEIHVLPNCTLCLK